MKAKVYQIVLGPILMLGSIAPVFAQQKLDRSMVYERLIAVVPMIGTGTYEDPRRPAYVPDYLSGESVKKESDRTVEASPTPPDSGVVQEEAPRPLIVSFSYELSDDEQFAIVVFHGTDSAAFEPMFKAAETPGASLEPGANRNALDGGFDLKVFEVGKVDPKEIEAEVRKQKASFKLEGAEVNQ